MGSEGLQRQDKIVKMLILLLVYLLSKVICETGDCREQEFRDHAGNCILCKQCGPGMELSKECGFGYGEDAQCMTCRLNRFKEDWGFQKCKPCLDCAVVNRFQKSNCSATSNAVCGDCLPGFYRKTKLGGFQDMECVPCGDPPPPYEPHCTIKVNLVKIPSTASSPRDTALAAVICSALATVLLALLILCVIYCKRQFMEKKQSWPVRSLDIHYNGSELSCFDRPRLNEYAHRTCCQCQQDASQTCGPVHLIPSLCCDETCSMEHSSHSCTFHSQTTLYERTLNSVGEMIPAFLGSLSHSACGDLSDAWPLMQNPACCDSISFCESYQELTGGDISSFDPEIENRANIDSDNDQDLSDVLISAKSHAGNFAESTELSKQSICVDASLVQNSSAPENLPMSECDETINHPTD
ncbi:tumor necrosis factor receptor superfamily member 19 isoform X1 [Mauremys reevesii]|uniref:tumor necrosis factor receptor superfamily member 19 isoform X1 n=2 Tax=Mauremys reevesii TaxID=260615 RepID=UPI00193F7F42|nr:tumor necrosis factor receptor superfamily member 19 isoform X1 [Mauremys reevesii]XP_039393001.1 tumor necrosis factor receptor superfamily member 19 isoform X1 [Mauremys reevesii]XP_039393010.1 tumor necrosis factor receptor superfamily member 19 isoform X1 [Mauremys reevesii]XP_039393020.1 tumor necrosis factor receptor superfamily member 19 isoform X1 [Mauremys reevesii]XP_039393027.1 tumor necrosis factor receptor superfamily member 19 isoform X1 [Mauremys reevesii]